MIGLSQTELNVYKHTLYSHFPDLHIETIDFLGEGDRSRALLVNGEWVFKFAKNQEGSEDLQKEAKILPFLSRHLTLKIPEIQWSTCQKNGLWVIGYPKVPGQIVGDALSHLDQRKIAKSLAQFLDELSTFPIEQARSLGVPENDFQKDFHHTFEVVRHTIFPLIDQPLRDQLTSLFNHYLNEAGYFEYQPTLIHADLSPNHYLYEDKAGELTGIIDFGDLHIGDPDFEYTYILEDGGEAFARQVMELRAEKEIDFLLKKVRIFVVFTHVATILEGLRLRDESMIDEGIATLRGSLDSFL